MRFEQGDRLSFYPRPLIGTERAVDPNVIGKIAKQDRSPELEPGGDDLPDFSRFQGRISASGARNAFGPEALRNVHSAMVGRENDRVIHPLRIEHSEETGQVAVEREQLQAHLLASGTQSVADIVGGGKSDGEHVRRSIGTEPHFLNEARGNRENRGIILGRRPVTAEVAGSSGEAPRPDRHLGRDRERRRLALAEWWRFQRRLRRGNQLGDLGVGLGDRGGDRCGLVVGGEALAAPIPALIDIASAHHHRGTVLARDGNVQALR